MIDENNVVNRTVQFVTNHRSLHNAKSDLTVIKEQVELKDGRVVPQLKYQKDVKRPFYVVKKGLRKYEQKKEHELIENCVRYDATQSEMPFKLNQLFNYQFGERPRLSHINRSPYVYGTDMSVTTYTKRSLISQYTKKFGDMVVDASMATLDFETDVVHGTEKIIMGAVTMKDKWFLAVTEDFCKGIPDYKEKVVAATKKYCSETLKERNVKIYLKVVKNNLQVVQCLMGAVHKMKPDVLAIWNMLFDIGKIEETCKEHNVDPATIMCDPVIPPEFRRWKFNKKEAEKKKADGQTLKLDMQELWHVVECPASFEVVDAMCLFSALRAVEQKRHSYSLEAILQEILKIGKLKIECDAHLLPGSIEWHRFMQTHHKVEYAVYCMWDGASMELLDEETGDIRDSLLPYVGDTDIARIKSNPRRLSDDYYFYLLGKGKILSGSSDDMTEKKFDHLTLGKRHWIVTLDNSLTMCEYTGVNPYDKDYGLQTRVSTFSFDIDVSSSYPSNQIAMNMSKGTTLVEVCRVNGLTEQQLRHVAVNITALPANSVMIANTMLGMPTLTEVAKLMEEDFKEAA